MHTSADNNAANAKPAYRIGNTYRRLIIAVSNDVRDLLSQGEIAMRERRMRDAKNAEALSSHSSSDDTSEQIREVHNTQQMKRMKICIPDHGMFWDWLEVK